MTVRNGRRRKKHFIFSVQKIRQRQSFTLEEKPLVVVVVVVVVFPLGTPFIGGRDSRPAMSLQCFRERCTVKPTVIEGQIYSWVRPLDTTFNLR